FMANRPGELWTGQLVPELAKANQTILTSVDNAGLTDPAGTLNPKAKKADQKETGQSANSKDGDKIVLTDAKAKNYVGIIYVGNPVSKDLPVQTAERYINTANDV